MHLREGIEIESKQRYGQKAFQRVSKVQKTSITDDVEEASTMAASLNGKSLWRWA